MAFLKGRKNVTKALVIYTDINLKILEDEIKPRLTQEVIEEHKRNPIGKHSDELERILIYLRKHNLQLGGKYLIVCTKPHQEWCIAELSGVRGIPPKIHEDMCFASREEAEHGVFIQRLKSLGLLPQVVK